MKWALLITLVYGAALVVSDDDLDLDLELPKVESPFPSIPGLENLPINKSALPNPEEVERVFREKCVKNGGEEAYLKAKEAGSEANTCLRTLINYEKLTEEMEKAKPTGDLDEVFRKYCAETPPKFKNCVMDFVNSTNLCLTEEERESKKIFQNVTEQLLGFICHKKGDRIALFIAESGPECLSDKKEAIIHCINQTFTKHLPSGPANLYDLPQFIIGVEECKDVCSLQRCVVKELEKCKEPTPGNIVQSLLNYLIKVTPCKTCEERPVASSSEKFRSYF